MSQDVADGCSFSCVPRGRRWLAVALLFGGCVEDEASPECIVSGDCASGTCVANVCVEPDATSADTARRDGSVSPDATDGPTLDVPDARATDGPDPDAQRPDVSDGPLPDAPDTQRPDVSDGPLPDVPPAPAPDASDGPPPDAWDGPLPDVPDMRLPDIPDAQPPAPDMRAADPLDAGPPDGPPPDPPGRRCDAPRAWSPGSTLWVADADGLSGYALDDELRPVARADLTGVLAGRPIRGMRLLPDGRRVALLVGAAEGALLLVDLDDAGLLAEHDADPERGWALTRDGRRAFQTADGVLSDRLRGFDLGAGPAAPVDLLGDEAGDVAVAATDRVFVTEGALVRGFAPDLTPAEPLDLDCGADPGRLLGVPGEGRLFVTAGHTLSRVDPARNQPVERCQDFRAAGYAQGRIAALAADPVVAGRVAAVVVSERDVEAADRFAVDLVLWDTDDGAARWRLERQRSAEPEGLPRGWDLAFDAAGALLFVSERGADGVEVLRVDDDGRALAFVPHVAVAALALPGPPDFEVCNGFDDDCDGAADEAFDYDGAAVGAECDGVGACGVGEVECFADGTRATCSTDPDGRASEVADEACNGADDDCDGEIDEAGPVLDVDPVELSPEGVTASHPRIVVAGDDVAAAWLDDRGGLPQLHLAMLASGDLGRRGRDRTFGDEGSAVVTSDLAWDGEGLLVAWQYGPPVDAAIQVRRTDAAGLPVPGVAGGIPARWDARTSTLRRALAVTVSEGTRRVCFEKSERAGCPGCGASERLTCDAFDDALARQDGPAFGASTALLRAVRGADAPSILLVWHPGRANLNEGTAFHYSIAGAGRAWYAERDFAGVPITRLAGAASTPGNFAAVYGTGAGDAERVWLQRLNPAGALGPRVALVEGGAPARMPVLTWTGGHYLAVWWAFADGAWRLVAQRFTAIGARASEALTVRRLPPGVAPSGPSVDVTSIDDVVYVAWVEPGAPTPCGSPAARSAARSSSGWRRCAPSPPSPTARRSTAAASRPWRSRSRCTPIRDSSARSACC